MVLKNLGKNLLSIILIMISLRILYSGSGAFEIFLKILFLKEIKRIFPQDTKYFTEGNIVIKRNASIQLPQWFRESYKNNKHKLFDEYYDKLINFVETNLVNLKPNFEKLTLGLTGGLDSRITAAILSPICKNHEISFECSTSGQDTHPDVVIAKKVAKVLNANIFDVHSPQKIDIQIQMNIKIMP